MRITVAGEKCIDRYIYGECLRLCPEGPVPVLNVIKEKTCEGMAANTYQNLRALLPMHSISSCFGHYPAIEKTRYVDLKTNQILLRVDSNDRIRNITRDQINALEMRSGGTLIVSDYNKGFLSPQDLCSIAKLFDFCILDTKKKLTQPIIDSFDFIKLNKEEYKNNMDMLNIVNRKKVIITLGSEGVMYDGQVYPPPEVVQTFDVSGAGDTFVAAFTASVVVGQKSLDEAIKDAQICCANVIKKRGTSVVWS